LSGKVQTVRATNLSTKRAMRSHLVRLAAPPTQVGTPPTGFGFEFDWDRTAEPQVVLAVFVNAADQLGVCITGLQPTDQIQVSSASGLATFSKDTGNPTLASLVGVLAAGAVGTLNATGNPEFDGLVTSAEQFAQQAFKGTGAGTKSRDAFGVDSSGGVALEEGGVIVCMPGAGGTFYSADPDHRNMWATQPLSNGAPRGLPKGVLSEGFPVTPFGFLGRTTLNIPFVCQQAGEAYIVAWDFAFSDNAGTYKLFVTLTNGALAPPPVILAKGKPNAHGAKSKVARSNEKENDR